MMSPMESACRHAGRAAQVVRAADLDLESPGRRDVEAGVDGVLVAQAWAAPVVQDQHVVGVGRVNG